MIQINAGKTYKRGANVFLLLLLWSVGQAHAQTGRIVGWVRDAVTNEAIAYATVGVQGTVVGAVTDSAGRFVLQRLPPGLYNLDVSSVGYKSKTVFEVEVMTSAPSELEIKLERLATELEAVVVKSDRFDKSDESPVSLRTIGRSEIQRNPGGNRDISKVLQSLPGVAWTVSFRNDLIIRGGAPNENRFYLDEVEVPNINHFSTQGSSGGPVGLINVDFLSDAEFYSGAFPAGKGPALSSILLLRQREARTDRFGVTATLGSSDLGFTLEGPLSPNSGLLFSVRRSYLQFLFAALALPFLPTYNDYQLKTSWRLNKKSQLRLISLGAYDVNRLNLQTNETPEQRYILGYLPENNQWNYTVGLVYKYFGKNEGITAVLSRNMLNNEAIKYRNNEKNSDNLLLQYRSYEAENKARVEFNQYRGSLKLNAGLAYEWVSYYNSTFNRINDLSGNIIEINYEGKLGFSKYGFFVSASEAWFDRRLVLTAGLRSDFSSYGPSTNKPWQQLSPRLAATVNLSAKTNVNFSVGRYYQLPPYTVLGYRDDQGKLVNRANQVRYIGSTQLAGGVEYYTDFNSRLSMEIFSKRYDHYPFMLRDSVSLANLGSDFGVIGNGPAVSTSTGKAYGLELLAQQKLYKGFYGIAAVTVYRSLFSDRNGLLVPSSWDNQLLVSLTAGKRFTKNWEIGIKWRFNGGIPFTPVDTLLSVSIPVWNVNGRGVPDYDQVNALRTQSFHQLDFRIDKKWFFPSWSFELYLDVQNAYNLKIRLPDYLDVLRDENGQPVADEQNPGYYVPVFVSNTVGTILPSIGVVISY
ncbi:MAG: TonB-dependent receptor [Chitinophagales bacterium]|nr:TonB-dependent receptor [Chitinophagales bacterium]MDW8427647.1 TonB-dependent receptor [Chitinophagales bacterium]